MGSSELLGGVAVALTCVLSLLLNSFALLLFFKRKRLGIRAHLIPLFHLAVVDWLAVVTWSVPSVAIAVADWSPPGEVCHAHAFFGSLWSMLRALTLAVLAVERAFRLVKPSRHVSIFVPRVVVFLLVGVWVFAALLSSIPHYGWLGVRLARKQMQCVVNYDASTALLNFDFCVRLALPLLVVALPCFVLAFAKVWRARKRASLPGEILLETSPYCMGPAYGERLTHFHGRFREIGVRSVKPTLGDKVFTDQGYVTDSDSDVDNVTAEELQTPRKVYSLAKREYVLLKTYVILTFLFLLLSLPYAALNLVVNYDPDESVPGWLETLVTCLSHTPQFVLPLVYLAYNDSFRRCVVKTLCPGQRCQQ